MRGRIIFKTMILSWTAMCNTLIDMLRYTKSVMEPKSASKSRR